MIHRFLSLLISCACLGALAGCKNPQVSQTSGTQLETNKDGKFEVRTYVSPEEYERMTPQERQRLRASQGVSASAQLWGETNSSPRDLPVAELDKAMSEAKSTGGK